MTNPETQIIAAADTSELCAFIERLEVLESANYRLTEAIQANGWTVEIWTEEEA
jgi:hypothetical protein